MRASEFSNTKLVIFDIDDTLVNTDTRVNVVKDGRVVRSLNSHEFTNYKLEPGEEFDFGAFRDAREFFTKARPIPAMINQLKQDIATGNKVIMVTARADFNDRDIFLDTFRKFGINMSKVHVYRAGNLAIKAATEEKKRIVIKQLLGKDHYDKVIMYDDSVPNLDAFLSLKQDYPWSKFYAWHVDHDGRASEYHRTDLKESQSASSQEVLQYLLKVHPPEETTPFLKNLVLKWPRYELRTVPLSQLQIPPPYYPDDAEEEDERVDPYGRTLWVDYDYAGEVSARNVDRLPIIVDPQGHIIDGNHRAWAAAELLNRDSIKAWVAVPGVKENFADGKIKGKSRPGRVKRAGASCKGSVTDLRARARKYGGERGKMYHWCANMKSGKKKK